MDRLLLGQVCDGQIVTGAICGGRIFSGADL